MDTKIKIHGTVDGWKIEVTMTMTPESESPKMWSNAPAMAAGIAKGIEMALYPPVMIKAGLLNAHDPMDDNYVTGGHQP